MILGVTGTRTFITQAQSDWLWELMTQAVSLHHGACTGADEAAHAFGLELDNIRTIHVHPPIKTHFMMAPDWNHAKILVQPAYGYQFRDRNIVQRSHRLAALPNTEYRPNSGTWYTINYARAIRRPVAICYPDGTVETR